MLAINQTAYYDNDDLQIRLANVTEDSRCPTDVQCVWAGQVSILVELARISNGQVLGQLALTKIGAGGNETLSSKTIDGYLVGLAEVEPFKVSTKKIEPSDYRAKLIILKTSDVKPDTILPSSPVILDSDGKNKLNELKVGDEVVVSMALHNNFREDKPFVSVIEVRSSDGVTQFLAFPNGIVVGNTWIDAGMGPWVPSQSGTYQLRTFLLDSLDAPQILSPIVSSEITVEEGPGGTHGNATNIIQGNNKFALDFYKAVAKENDGNGKGNVFFSPWSISTALALVDEGAKGKTADEVESVFGLPSDDNIRRTQFQSVLQNINGNNTTYQKNYTLDTANAVWVKEGYHLSDDYVNVAKHYYESEVKNGIFTTEEGRRAINGWVELKTHDKIKDLIPPGVLDDFTRLVITNAVYFKGTWVTQFDENETTQQDFKVSQDKTVKVDTMQLDKPSFFKYGETQQLRILELPYEGRKLSMLVLLPKDGNSLNSIQESLSLDSLSMWKNVLRNQSVIVSIPKFKLEASYTLNTMLSDLGMPSAFDPNAADLTGMLAEPEQLYIQAALHKAFVEVNEQGTEAAGATGVVIGTTSVHEYPVFNADHPFIFLIQDIEKGNILFMGQVLDPS